MGFLKHFNHLPYLIIFTLVGAGFSCQEKEKTIDSTSEDLMYTLDITDSVMIDYIGQIAWSDISSDGKHILATNPQNSDIFLISIDGEIIGNFNKSGDQPDAIGGSPLSRPQFVKENEWAILGRTGLKAYNFDGQLTRTAKQDFPVLMSLVMSNNNILHFINDSQALVHLMGRDRKNTYYINPEFTQLEMADLKHGSFTPELTIPDGSKNKNPDKTHSVINGAPVFDIHDGKLFLGFKNEPKIWIYDIGDLENPLQQIDLKIDGFIEKEGIDRKNIDDKHIQFDARDFAYGGIDKLTVKNNLIIIQYKKGLKESEFQKIKENTSDQMDVISKVFDKNKAHFAVVQPTGDLNPIIMPKKMGSIEFVDMEGNLWVGYNREEELDYEVLYKTKLKKVKK